MKNTFAALTFSTALALGCAPHVAAAPTTGLDITPVGYNIVGGAQDTTNPITDSDLILDTGFSETAPNFGQEYVQEQIIGEDERDEVADTTQAPYRWIGTLTYTAASGRQISCSGTLISADAVITAGHCLKPSYTNITFTPGKNGSIEPYGSAKAIQVWRDKNLGDKNKQSESDAGRDWGIVKLDSPIGEKTGWFGMKTTTATGIAHSAANIAGYPSDKNPHTMWIGRGEITKATDRELFHTADTYSGNSGAVVFDNAQRIYGIHLGGTRHSNNAARMSGELFNVLASIAFTDVTDLGVTADDAANNTGTQVGHTKKSLYGSSLPNTTA